MVGQYFQVLGYSEISPLISTPSSSVLLELLGAVQLITDVPLEPKLPPFGNLDDVEAIFQLTAPLPGDVWAVKVAVAPLFIL